MSADNGHFVCKVVDEDNNNLYGVYYYMGDPPSIFTRARAIKLFKHPVAAILGALRHEEAGNYTEYGVSVHTGVMRDCRSYFTDWEVKK